MEWVFLLALVALFGAGSAFLAGRKGRSRGWWFLGGALGGLPALLLAEVAPPAGEPWRFRSPVVLLALAFALVASFALLAVIAQYS